MLSDLTFIKDNDFATIYTLVMDENMSDKWNGRYEKMKMITGLGEDVSDKIF